MNNYQKIIAKIAKDDVINSFVKTSFRIVRSEVRKFVKDMDYDIKELLEHKNYCKEQNAITAKFK